MGSNDDDFSELRRILRLKRHEPPPPGFFDRLPDRVRRRIVTEAATPPETWWARLTAAFSWRPALAGAFALGALSFLGWRAGQLDTLAIPTAPTLAQEWSPALPGRVAHVPVLATSANDQHFIPVVPSATSSVSGVLGSRPPEALFKHQLGNDFVLRASALVPLSNASP